MSNPVKGLEKFEKELIETANKIVAKGKGVLAADESTGTIGKRLDMIKVENIEENRRAYRELLVTTEGIENYISAIIMFDETVYQKTKEGTRFIDILKKKGIVPGIKVDKGTVKILGTDGETYTQGLDDLNKRCAKYYEEGCRFAKWRAVLKIGKNEPTNAAILENVHGLARYARICQENGLVPIIEPEILADGEHTIDECAEKTEKVLSMLVQALHEANVMLEGALLKPNMVTTGFNAKEKAGPKEIAEKTVRTLLRTIPPAMPGVVFLSGGQTEEEATLNLNEMNKVNLKRPWALSFSFGRALQQSCLKAWQGKPENVKAGQDEFLKRAKANSMACTGTYQA